MILTPWQVTVAEDRHRFRVINVGRRAGKTTLAIEEIKGKAIFHPNKISYVAPTHQQARDIAWEELKKQLKPVFACPPNESRLEIKTKTRDNEGESIITLRGWESIETLRGQSLDFLVIDEVAMMRDFWANWHEVIRPTLTDRRGEVMFISTPKGYNFFYDLYNMELKDKDYKSFHFTSYDNPHIPKEEIDKAALEISETRFAQEFLADFRKVEGLVYKEFSRERHLYEELPKDTHFEYVGGVDFGFTNPAAVAHVYKDRNGNYFMESEWYQRGRTENQVADYVLSCKFNAVYPDPENPSAITLFSQKGIPIKEVIKNKDSVKNGINKIRDLFKQNRLKINKRCINMISELESYSYPDYLIGSKAPEEPLKENDHLCFTKDTVIDVPIGTILRQESMGYQDVYDFMGSKVTANHPYLTQRGFVALDSLRYSDSIIIWKNKILTELSLGDIQNLKGVQIGVISHLLQRNVSAIKQNAYIGIYGKRNLEIYLRVYISIIKTVIHLITSYLISNVYHLKSILKNIIKSFYLYGGKILLKLLRRPLFGIEVKRELSGIVNMERKVGLIDRLFNDCVTNVESHTKLLFRQDQNSAMIIAKLRHCGKEEVFSTLTSNGFFTANGVVVSNCDALRYIIYMDFIVRKKTIAEKPRQVLSESRYEGTIPAHQVEDDELSEQELAHMG